MIQDMQRVLFCQDQSGVSSLLVLFCGKSGSQDQVVLYVA